MPGLIKSRAAWVLVKQWAADAVSFVELEKELTDLGVYDYRTWRETFQKIEVASDPTKEHPVSAVDIVIQDARAHGISLEHTVNETQAIADPFPLCPSLYRANGFVVPDGEGKQNERPCSLPGMPRVYPATPTPGHQPQDEVESGVEDEVENSDTDLEELDDIGLWKSIQDWLSGTLNFEYLTRLMEFQHGKYPKIDYWEDFVSQLAFESDLEKREMEFTAISLVEHHRRLTNYNSTSVLLPRVPPSALEAPSRSSTHSSVVKTADSVISSSAARRGRILQDSSKRPRQSRKRRKLCVNRYLDLDAAEDDEDEAQIASDDEILSDLSRFRKVQHGGLSSLADDFDDIANRYGTGVIRPNSPPSLAREGSNTRCYSMDFYSQHTARYILEDLKYRVAAALISPWLPRRLYVQASSPLQIRQAINPSHRDTVRDIILVPPTVASQIFSTRLSIPCRSWARIRKGKYKHDLGYIFKCDGDTIDVLVVPRQRPYDLLYGQQNVRALFDWQAAFEVGIDLTLIENSRNITAFQYEDSSYFAGLLRLSLPKDHLERVLVPHPEEIFLYREAGIDPNLVEESHVLFSSQFWIKGDAVRSSSTELLGAKPTIQSVDFDQRVVSLLLDGQVYHCPLLEQRRVLSLGDHLRIIAGPNRGYTGMVVALCPDEIVLCSSTDLTREVRVSNYYVETYRPDHRWQTDTPALSQGRTPLLEKDSLQLGDLARVIDGPHRGLRGHIDWVYNDLVWVTVPIDDNDDQPEDPELENLGGDVACVPILNILSTPVPNLLNFTKERGYDVGVGDEVRIGRGRHWGHQGVVKNVRSVEAQLDVLLPDGSMVTVPITWCVKFANFTQREASKLVGKEVWVVGGEFKGRRATLDALGRHYSQVSMYAHPVLNIPNHQIAAPSGVLLTGQMLDDNRRQQLIRLIRKSFVQTIAKDKKTPPPSPQASCSALPSISEDPAWVTGPDDVATSATSAKAPDHGGVSWLFDDGFCDFSSFHLTFNVDLRYNPSFLNRVARTTCPDRFCGPAGPSPEGRVSLTVPGHNRGSGLEYHHIPAEYLKPALPSGSGKEKYALILTGEHAGEIHPITKYRRTTKEVQLAGSWFSCKVICPAYQSIHVL